VRRLLSLSDTRASGAAFAPERAWRLSPKVALRDEAFGALAYHYGNRRLVFLKSPVLVDLVTSLERYDSAADAVQAVVQPGQYSAYMRALARLAASEVIDAR
jgi:mycofactocin biosynthesis protein MftB